MFQDIQTQKQIKFCERLLGHIRLVKLETLILVGSRKFDSRGRDIVAEKATTGFHLELQPPEHFSGSAADVTDRAGGEPVPLDQFEDVLRFPGRVFHVPLRNLLKILARNKDVGWHLSLARRPNLIGPKRTLIFPRASAALAS